MTPERLVDDFERVRTSVESIEQTVRSTLAEWVKPRKYIFTDRKKLIDSLSEKLESGRFVTWSQIDDLYACSVIVPTAESEDEVLSFLDNVFDVVAVKSRANVSKPPDAFRFDTTRASCRLKPVPGLERPEYAEQLLFEVQVPTSFQYAWSIVTRDYVYKSDSIDWTKQRLVAQLKAAVEQIELIITSFDLNAEAMTKSGHAETDAKQDCLERLIKLRDDGFVPEPLVPTSWSRLVDNLYSLVKSYIGAWSAPAEVTKLTEEFDVSVRSAARPLPNSGTLFQAFVGLVNEGGGKRTISKYAVYDSAELRDFHGVDTVGATIEFDIDSSVSH